MTWVEWIGLGALAVMVWPVFDMVALLAYAACFAVAVAVGVGIQWLLR